MPEIPETLTRSYCPEHGDVTGRTFFAPRDLEREKEWCYCNRPVDRVTFHVELLTSQPVYPKCSRDQCPIEESTTGLSRRCGRDGCNWTWDLP